MELLPNVSPAKSGIAIKFVLSYNQLLQYEKIEKEIDEKGYNLSPFFDVSGNPVFCTFLATPKKPEPPKG